MSLDSIRQWARREQVELLAQATIRTVDLSLAYLRQQAHYATPAGHPERARKAAEAGFEPLLRIMEKYAISAADLGAVLGVERDIISDLLAGPFHAPLVLLDGEDAQIADPAAFAAGRQNAVDVLRNAHWGPSLRYYRPNGLQLDACIEDLITVLDGAAKGRPASAFPLDGIIFPKLEQPEQARWLDALLTRLEAELGLRRNTVRVQLLIESAWAVIMLPELASAMRYRLTGLVFGHVDYASDIALPDLSFRNPVADWARAQVVNVAGAFGVPAINGMTMNYPVADPALTQERNRQLILDRMWECFVDARHGIQMGMKGKWVGHPAQLFVTLLAYHLHHGSRGLQQEINKIRRYQEAIVAQDGVTVIDGVMSDRATDRHARVRLREAVALGLLSSEEGLALNIISPTEAAALPPRNSFPVRANS